MAPKIALFLACMLFVATVVTAWEEKNDNYIHVVKRASESPAVPSEGATLDGAKCVELCEVHCKSYRRKRACVHPCTACCSRLQCVPINGKKCDLWTTVLKKGEEVRCPK